MGPARLAQPRQQCKENLVMSTRHRLPRFPRRALALTLVTCAALGAATLTPVHAAGGAFTASYSGTFKETGNCITSSCTVTLSGKGSASFLGASSESATLKGQACKTSTGTGILRSTVTSSNSLTMTVTGKVCLGSSGITISGTYKVAGGTGAFKGATGSGTITGTATVGTSGTYKDSWKGTLTYP